MIWDLFPILAPALGIGVAAGCMVGPDIYQRLPKITRAHLPKRKRKVDAITDLTQWKRARRLEDRQAWQREFDLVSPPELTERARVEVKAMGWRTRSGPNGQTIAFSRNDSTVLEWTSAGWHVVQTDKRNYSDEARLHWLQNRN